MNNERPISPQTWYLEMGDKLNLIAGNATAYVPSQ